MDDPTKKQMSGSNQPQRTSQSSLNKEVEPIKSGLSSETLVRLSEEEPRISNAEQEAGVNSVQNEQPLPQEVREQGMDFAKESQTPNLNPTLNVPMTKAQATQNSKGSVNNSLTWLATLIAMLFKKEKVAEEGAK